MSISDRIYLGLIILLGIGNLGLAALIRSASGLGYAVIAVAWFALAFFYWKSYR